VTGVHILHPRPEKLPVTTNVSQKCPSAIFDDLNIDWLSVQKDIVIVILCKIDSYDTDFTGWTFSGKVVCRYMGFPTYIRFRWYKLEDDGSACINRWWISPIRWVCVSRRNSHGLTNVDSAVHSRSSSTFCSNSHV
jgi:hypothetical protein